MTSDLRKAGDSLANAADKILSSEMFDVGEAARELSDCLAVWRAASAESPAAALDADMRLSGSFAYDIECRWGITMVRARFSADARLPPGVILAPSDQCRREFIAALRRWLAAAQPAAPA